MRNFIEALQKYLREHPGIEADVKAYQSTERIPEKIPCVNIIPRSRERKRMYVIGSSSKIYDANPVAEVHVWSSSMKSLQEAFYQCDDLANDVLDALANLQASDLGVDYHESQIESFDDGEWEATFYYMAVIVISGITDDEH